ncbi:MAG: DUF3365 domain-containing protein [Phycisphaerae bacterium]|jgi:PAS domain S-box-containing protein
MAAVLPAGEAQVARQFAVWSAREAGDMAETNTSPRQSWGLRRCVLSLTATWTVIVVAFFVWTLSHEHQKNLDFLRDSARAAFDKDIVYRRWNASHGGVYAPVTEDTPPNPQLAHLEERDLVTPSGRRLTLVNPAYMTRQVHELGREQYGIRSHITSLNPIRAANAPDSWEKMALKEFEQAVPEVSSVAPIEGKPYLRLMRPLITEKGCLKCHAAQGYKEGDVRGGISVSAPLQPYLAAERAQRTTMAFGFGLLWLIGLGGIGLATVRLRRRVLERARIGTALRDSEEKVRLLLSSTAEAIYSLDLDGSCTLCNPACLKMLRYESSQQVLNKNMHDLIHHTWADGSPYPEDRCRINEAIQRGEGTHVDDEVLWRADGTSFPAEYWSYPICRDGEVVGAVVTFLDITERRQAEHERRALEARLHESQKLEAVGQLAGGIAHDFNNILTAILGNVELSMECLRKKLGADHGAIGPMEQVNEAAQRAARLTRQLLTFSRRDVVQPEVLNLNRVLENLEKMLRRLITENVTFEAITDPQLKSVHADASQLEQVIVNLVVNAVHAMPDGGQLTLETRNVTLDEQYADNHTDARPGPAVLLAVTDTGHGMDAETCKRIFEPFFTTKAADKGTGLGLATVYGIVQRSRGHIAVHSEPGQGTTFEIYLPAAEAVAEEEPAQQKRSTDSLRGSETVLLCEDEDPVRELTARTLRTAGYAVITARGGHEALQAVRNHKGPIDLLITDVIMPDMNGHALSEQLHEARPTTPTLFISGYTADVVARHGVLDEGVEFLQKPFTRWGLLAKIRTVLDQKRAEAARE